MLEILAKGFVVTGICILGCGLIIVRRLMVQLPSGPIRNKWYIQTVMIGLFISGYLGYAITHWNQEITWSELFVPTVFFFGAGFVWLTITLSLQTASDLHRLILLEQENITDPLVGIFNRRYLNRRLDEESTSAHRHNRPLSVLLIDIDNFKLINDTHGHLVGDIILSDLGDLLLQLIRPSDIATRYGGEEFLIIAPNTTSASAGVLAERIRQNISSHTFVVQTESKLNEELLITVSIGVASYNQQTTDSKYLISNADEALYHAKNKGRNRVIMYRDIKAQPRRPKK